MPPRKLTPEAHMLIVEAVGNGASMDHAADYAGVGRSTLMAWLAAARNGTGSKQELDLLDGVTRARGRDVNRLLQIMREAGEKDWRAAEASLRCRYGYSEKITAARIAAEAEAAKGADAGKSLDDLLMEAGPDALRRALAKLTGD